MKNFSESLTVRILGDSSQLQKELGVVARGIDQLADRFSKLAAVDQQMSRSFGRMTSLLRPVNQLSRLLDRVTGQIRTLSRTPIQLNVMPAIRSLSLLAQTAIRVGSLIQRISSITRIPQIPTPQARNLPRAPVRLAGGGLVTGQAGTDRVPALLTAGEFVLRQPVVERLGISLLDSVNRNQSVSSQNQFTPVEKSTSTQVNHFGGINIQVAQSSNINNIVRDLRLHGFHLRNRRG